MNLPTNKVLKAVCCALNTPSIGFLAECSTPTPALPRFAREGDQPAIALLRRKLEIMLQTNMHKKTCERI